MKKFIGLLIILFVLGFAGAVLKEQVDSSKISQNGHEIKTKKLARNLCWLLGSSVGFLGFQAEIFTRRFSFSVQRGLVYFLNTHRDPWADPF